MHQSDMRQVWGRINWGKIRRIARFRGYGGLKILVLYLLSEEPRNGAELIETIEIMSHGHWKPSPGSIYPILSKAVEDNLILKREDRRYELTAAGLEEVSDFTNESQSQPVSVESILNDMDSNLSFLEDLSRERMVPYIETLESIEVKLRKMVETLRSPEDTT
ncbi:MAG: PadR family transcriptional regulator [Methanospirillum sp.]|nr:PadR family transcriptional regulator [Methanospirillum sp.]